MCPPAARRGACLPPPAAPSPRSASAPKPEPRTQYGSHTRARPCLEPLGIDFAVPFGIKCWDNPSLYYLRPTFWAHAPQMDTQRSEAARPYAHKLEHTPNQDPPAGDKANGKFPIKIKDLAISASISLL
eukprot:CAMPEP_0182907138 /NCGR_PEP_ID=MMETSP0034_2-20130328/34272_1 /TAXON_ID=156128 /ORGANISM="Nephroselmis pyriformis, Strain CCMP717" /LENGTH=128 /DNA_ID=CAMNT_0025043013 /DNA_START=12 /DNA_END=395 /DNA_ORIENTATION=+